MSPQRIPELNVLQAYADDGMPVGAGYYPPPTMVEPAAHVYARDLPFSSTELQAGHRLETNSVRGGFIRTATSSGSTPRSSAAPRC